MSEVVTGKVEKIITTESKDGKTIYAVIVGDNRYGFYTNNPARKGVKKGTVVKFRYTEHNGFYNGDFKSLTVVSDGEDEEATVSIPQAAAAKPVQRTGSYGRDSETQAQISRQAARNSAIEWLNVLLAQGAIAFPAKANAALKEQILTAALNHYTELFFRYATTGKHESVTVSAEKASARKTGGDKPSSRNGVENGADINHSADDEDERDAPISEEEADDLPW